MLQKTFDLIGAARRRLSAKLPVVLISGNTDPALINNMGDRHVAVYYKPIQIDALEAYVREATEHCRKSNWRADRLCALMSHRANRMLTESMAGERLVQNTTASITLALLSEHEKAPSAKNKAGVYNSAFLAVIR